ncbi:MAG: amino acid ABC transporter substrate-binding protein [Desulfomonile tiedjei]|uniref:Amino acid ABC transporter substrate-binding protein n=1 Tax=Desulfomonile tiedjei TaxID=2358 RepID=A0A9D6Z532_9BACT|nr:amino acid ABC transporter substrate-binding protein [Desulfomonile tiedjei]
MERGSRKLISIIAIVACLAVVPWLTGKSMAADNPIVIGGSLPLTGESAEPGLWVERGMKFWADEINAKGGLLGRPVTFKIYDDESSPQKAVTIAEKAITVDKVDLLFGGYPGTAARAVMPVAEKHKYVYVSMGGHMKSFEQGYKYSFGAPPLMGEWWYEGFFEWLATIPADQRPKKAAVYTMNNPIGTSLLDSIERWTKKLNIEKAIDEKYNLPLPDATPLILKAKQMNCDLLFANGLFPDGVMVVRAAKALDYNPKAIVQGIGSVIPAWLKELGKDGYYVFSGTSLHNKLNFPGNDKLNAYVKEKFGLDGYPVYFGFGYAWMQSLGQAVEGAKSLDQTKIRDWLRANKVETICGHMTVDDKGLTKPINFCTQMIDGQVELIWPLNVRTKAPVYPKPPWN